MTSLSWCNPLVLQLPWERLMRVWQQLLQPAHHAVWALRVSVWGGHPISGLPPLQTSLCSVSHNLNELSLSLLFELFLTLIADFSRRTSPQDNIYLPQLRTPGIIGEYYFDFSTYIRIKITTKWINVTEFLPLYCTHNMTTVPPQLLANPVALAGLSYSALPSPSTRTMMNFKGN